MCQWKNLKNLCLHSNGPCSQEPSKSLVVCGRELTNISDRTFYVEKLGTGFLAWKPTVKGYVAPSGDEGVQWEAESQATLDAMTSAMAEDDYFLKLAQLWSQESSRKDGTTEIRGDNVTFFKSLGQY